MDFTIITRAGLSQQEAGDLIGVSRVTMNHYTKGKCRPMASIETRMAKVFDVLERLVTAEKLPKNIRSKDKAARALLMAKLHTVVEKHLAPQLTNE
jgi:DNA-binding XRE family transcriptional regulator